MPDLSTLEVNGVEYTIKDKNARPNTWTPTAKEVGARPADWMPTADDVKARPDTWMPTASQVGAAPASHATDKSNPHGVTAAQVGARPDTWMPTPAEIGAALAGYGLGTGGVFPSSLSLTGCAIARGGFYRWDTQPSDAPFANAVMLVIPRTQDASAFQIACCAAGTNKGTIAVRSYTSSSGGEWEYINPPMSTGVEYRTTKRANGAVVYTKRFSFGDLPNATAKRVQIPSFTSSYTAVNTIFTIKNKTTCSSMNLAYGADPGYFMEQASASVVNLVVNTSGDFSGYTGTVTIEYTK